MHLHAYSLSDSVVAVTSASGTLLSEQRYLPFGQVRTDVGPIIQTDFGFTGQRNLDAQSNTFSLGLMDYKARFYNQTLGCFVQPDTILTGGPQGSNRYAYVDNNPISRNDLSGHRPCEFSEGERCGNIGVGGGDSLRLSPVIVMARYSPEKVLEMAGVEIYNIVGWSVQNVFDAAYAVLKTGFALMNAGAGNSWFAAFQNTYGTMAFVWGLEYNGSPFSGKCANFGGGGCSPGMINGKRVIAFNDLPNYTGLQFSTLVTHELGHIFSYTYGWSYPPPHAWGASDGTSGLGSNWLGKADQILYGNPPPSEYRHASSSTDNEMFADMFTAWVYGVWNNDIGNIGDVTAASNKMSADMSLWIP